MKIFAPGYYKEFVCIADRCTHSCCIGWEIDIDADTMKKYDSLTLPYGEKIRKSIENADECPRFALCEGERCPHLDERGLCRIITNLGEDHLCNICREHPRFYNRVSQGFEAGLGLSCEEAARLILSSDNYGEMAVVGETEDDFEVKEFDCVALRNELYSILSNKKIPYVQRIEEIYQMYDVSPKKNGDSLWREIMDSLEFLEESHRELFSCYTSDIVTPLEYEYVLERALAYFVYRHTGAAENLEEWKTALGFALFCERLLCSVLKKGDVSPCEAARIISEELEYSEDNTEALKLEFMF